VLLLTESREAHWFEHLREAAAANAPVTGAGAWRFLPGAESTCLRAINDAGSELLVVAGSQIVTAEQLEVLALITEQRFPDGDPIGEVMRTVAATGTTPVLPWGFGKWTGRRGRIMKSLIDSHLAPETPFLLGDNGGRLGLTPKPRLLRRAEAMGLRVLPGSDPLPIPSQQVRPGSYLACWDGVLDPRQPVTHLRRLLASEPFVTHGNLEKLLHFAANQFSMQLIKRRRSRVS
jgi:hypothetical protein